MTEQQPWWHEGNSSGHDDAVGNAAQEAAKLFTAVRDRVLSDPGTMRAGMAFLEGLGQLRGGSAAPGEAPECAYCPVCQAIAAAQRINPESMERVTGAAIEFAEVVRSTLSDEEPTEESGLHTVPLDDDEGEDDGGEGRTAARQATTEPDDEVAPDDESATPPDDEV